MAAVSTLNTPMNTLSRDNLFVRIRNNVMNDSYEFSPAADVMETDSPMRKAKSLQPITKKLFHSPMPDNSTESTDNRTAPSYSLERCRKARKRKQMLVPNSCEKIKQAFVKECDGDGYSPEVCGKMRRKMLISLFHNKEYSMDFE